MENEKTDDNSPSSITGKKIFFLYPTTSLQNQVILELIQQEFEVYIAKDHTRLMRSLKKYNDSIVYVNIDDRINEEEWEKWITSVMNAAPAVNIGIFSSNTNEELKEKFTHKLKVTCGFLVLKVDMGRTADAVMEILKAMDAKGRRKYLRTSIDRETKTTINMPFNGDYINGIIKDISVVGISLVFDSDPDLKKNSLYKDIQIRLQSMLLKVEAVVFGTREDSGEKTYVLLFTQRIDPEVRTKIRSYVQKNLQLKMDTEIN